METIGMYFLKMTCWLMVFWLVYYFFLKKDRSYKFNRWFLVTGMISSIFMPLYTLRYTVIEEITAAPPPPPPLATINTVTENAPSSPINWWAIVYLVGISSFLIITTYRLIRIHKLEMKGERTQHGNTNIIVINHDLAPFSFFNKIFVSHSLQGNTEIDSVIAHEKVHIEEKHWIDLFLLGIIRVLQWFNPLINLYRKAVMQNHEFLADSGAMQKGINPFAYKALLANQMLGYQVVGAVSSFGSINPSKRIEMMNKNKFKRKKQWLSLTVLPLIALVLFAFAKPEYEYITSEENSEMVVKQTETSGVVSNEKGDALPGVTIIVEGTTVGTITDMEGKFLLKKIDKKAKLAFMFPGYEKASLKAKKSMKVVLIKSAESDEKLIINDDEIAPPPPPPPGMRVSGTVTDENGEAVPGTSVIIKGSTRGTISNMEGKFELSGISNSDEIVFSFVGMQTVILKAKSKLNPVLKPKTIMIYAGDNPPPPPPPAPPKEKFKNKKAKVKEKFKNQSNEEKEVFIVVENMPQVEGGSVALIKHAEKVFGANFFKEGEAILFTVKADGNIGDLRFNFSERIPQPTISDAKVKNFISTMPSWKPGLQRGKPVSVKMSILF